MLMTMLLLLWHVAVALPLDPPMTLTPSLEGTSGSGKMDWIQGGLCRPMMMPIMMFLMMMILFLMVVGFVDETFLL